MKKFYPLLCLFILLLSFKQDQPVQFSGKKFKLAKGVTYKDYQPNTVIIKFKSAKGDRKAANLSGSVKKQLSLNGIELTEFKKIFVQPTNANQVQTTSQQFLPDLGNIYEAKFSGNQSITNVINNLLADEQIAYAEPSYIYYTSYLPNDANYNLQSYLGKVQAPQAWDILKNASSVVIGIVDSGSDLQHQDLAANIYLNTADPINGIDDDRDGYIDNYQGWDFVGLSSATMIGDNDPDVKSDTTDHGVHVSGIASAVSDNGVGVASIAFNAKLLIVKAGADNNGRAIYKGYEGIKYAADHSATIINCSWGGAGGGQFGQDMIDYAIAKGCLVVAAAGNENVEEPIFPAAYDGVLAVASVTLNDTKSSFSNYNYKVDITAIGSGVYNTLNGNRYGSYSGTSMASPMVASAAALVKAKYPQYSGIQIGELLRQTSDAIDNINPTFAGKLGKGRLNVYRALTENATAVRYQQIVVSDQSNGSRAAGTAINFGITLKNFLAPVNGLTMNIASASPYVQVLDQNTNVGNLATLETKNNLALIRINVLANAPQNQEISFIITYTGNNGAFIDREYFTTTVALDYLNITVNQVSSTLSSNGRVGFSKADALGGLGFVYKNENMLYEAALMIGKSTTQVANNARFDGDYSEDFLKQDVAKLIVGTTASFEGTSTFTDKGSSNPIGLKVISTMLAYPRAPDDKYVIVAYEIFNTSTEPLSDVYAGLFTDWDLDESSANATKYDATNKLAYAFAKKNAAYPYAGVRLLRNTAPAAYYPMSYQVANDPLGDNKFTIEEKYKTLSSGIKSTGLGDEIANGYDIMFTVGSGPYQIPVNGSIKVAYAFVAGDNLADLNNVASAAQSKYNLYASSSEPNVPVAVEYSLDQNYPNAATQYTNIPFTLPAETQVKLVISNVQGKIVQTLVNKTLTAGRYDIYVDLSRYSSGVYFYKLKAGNFEKALKMIVVK